MESKGPRGKAPSLPEQIYRQWPALAATGLVHLLIQWGGFAFVAGQVDLSWGQTVAIALFLLLFALAEVALLVLVNAAFEVGTSGIRRKVPLDLVKALLLGLAVVVPAASLFKFLTTRAHLRFTDLWFAVTNAPQLLQESLSAELGGTLLAAGAFLGLLGGLYAGLRLLRRYPTGGGVSTRSFVALLLLALAGCAVAYARYAAVPVFARYLVPEIHWAGRLAAGASELPSLTVGGNGVLGLQPSPMEPWAPRAGETVSSEQPNIVLIMLESVPWTALGIGGGRPGVTPHLDRLARESVVFTRAYTPSVHSDYAQVAILSSLYPRKFAHHDYYTDLTYPRTLLWDVLASAGWTTSMFSCQNEHWGNMRSYLQTPGLGLFRHSMDWPEAPHKGRGSESKVFEETVVEAWKAWVEREPRRPFFSYLNFQATHFPYVIPPPAPRPFTPFEMDFPASFFRYPVEKAPVMRNRFDNALAYADAWVGQVVAALEARGEWDDTVLVVVSDHGEAFYEHEQPTHGSALDEEQVRSVWMMRLPGEEPRWIDEPVSLLDLAPALVSYLGLPPHGNFQGRGDVLGASYRAAGRPLFFTIQGVTFEDGVLLDDLKYTLNWDRRQQRLFDLATDPGETSDVVGERPVEAARLQRVLGELLAAQLDYYRSRAWEEGLYPSRLP